MVPLQDMNKTLFKQANDVLRANIVPLILFFIIVLVQIIKIHLGLYSIDANIVTVNSILFFCFMASIIYSNREYEEAFRRLITLVIPLFVALITLGMYTNPVFIDAFAVEDGPVENLSAIICFTAAGMWLIFALNSLVRRNWRLFVVSGVFFAVLALIGLEEISWGQRIVGVESGEFFLANNVQGEINLHNLNTSLSEKIFYTVGIVSLVIVPFFRDRLTNLLHRVKLGWLEIFLPSAWLSLPFSVIIGLSGILIIGWVSILFVTVAVLAILLYEADTFSVHGHKWKAMARIACILILIAAAVTFTNFDYEAAGIRNWMGSEYLELFIEAGLLVYTIDFMFRYAKRGGYLATKH